MERTDTPGGSFRSLLRGAAVGAVLGVLFAPRPGYELRENFNDWLSQRRRRARSMAEGREKDVREGLQEAYQEDIERHDKEPMGI